MPSGQRAGSVKFILGMTLLAAVFVGFVLLGNWQVRRYHLKLGIARDIAMRVHAPPVDPPGPAGWPRVLAGHEQYLHVKLHGRFIGSQTLVHGSSPKGYGYWVMAPLRTDRGFIVLVNRGYVAPATSGTSPQANIALPDGEVTIAGLLRPTEPHGGFLRRNRPEKNLWYSRDVAAIAASDHLPADQVAPYYVDADATDESGPPYAGLANVHIYNHSLGYAVTWYLLALGTLLALGILIREHRLADA